MPPRCLRDASAMPPPYLRHASAMPLQPLEHRPTTSSCPSAVGAGGLMLARSISSPRNTGHAGSPAPAASPLEAVMQRQPSQRAASAKNSPCPCEKIAKIFADMAEKPYLCPDLKPVIHVTPTTTPTNGRQLQRHRARFAGCQRPNLRRHRAPRES